MRLSDFRGAALGLALVAPALAGSPAVAAELFSAEQRQAIEAIIRDYLIKNPEVMIDVLEAAKDKLSSEAQATRATALAERRQEIFEDPNAPVAGNPKGDVTLVEFFDYRCPYCKQVAPAIDALARRGQEAARRLQGISGARRRFDHRRAGRAGARRSRENTRRCTAR